MPLDLKSALSWSVMNRGQITSDFAPKGEVPRAENEMDNGTRGVG
jgi:hypothetical protein